MKTFLPNSLTWPGPEDQGAFEFVQNLPWITGSESLLERFKRLLLAEFHITSLRLLLIDPVTETQGLYLSHPPRPFRLVYCFQSSSPIVRFFNIDRAGYFTIDTDSLEPEALGNGREARQQLQDFYPDAKLCFPLVAGGSLAGLLLVGPREKDAPYTPSDLQRLILLTKEVSSALERILGTDELSLLGGLSAGIAHDLQNLLTPLSTLIQLYNAENRGRPEEGELLALSLKNIETIHGYIRHALHLSVPPKPQEEILRLDHLVHDALSLTRNRQAQKKIEISFRTPPKVELRGDRIFILRLLGNLIDNAIKASPAGAALSLELWNDTEWIHLSLQDQGPGFCSEARERIFLRTFQISGSGEGKAEPGLGLAICRKIVSLHRGKIIIKNGEERGARIDLLLPPYSKAPSQRSK